MFTVKSLPQIGYKFFFYIHYGKEIDLKEEYGNNPINIGTRSQLKL